jgi:hypothetical protein
MYLQQPNVEYISENGISIYSERKNGYISYLQIVIGDTMFKAGKYYGDSIAESYYMQFVNEMAYKIDKLDEVNPLGNSKQSRMTEYFLHNRDPIHISLADDVKTHRRFGDTETSYTTLDHTKKEAVHRTWIVKNKAGDRLPFEHETQEVVERVDHPAMNKGYATDLLYMHFLRSKHPLSSSDKQQYGGYKMWEKISHRALDDGHHVYLWNNLDKSLHQLDTHEKVDSCLQHYYSPTEKRSKDFGHMIISKTKLD